MATTSNIRSTQRDSGGWCKWRRKKPAGAKKKQGNGFGMGLAMHRSFLTYVATVVQMQMDDAGQVHVERVDTALDAGTVVNPEMVEQQFGARR